MNAQRLCIYYPPIDLVLAIHTPLIQSRLTSTRKRNAVGNPSCSYYRR